MQERSQTLPRVFGDESFVKPNDLSPRLGIGPRTGQPGCGGKRWIVHGDASRIGGKDRSDSFDGRVEQSSARPPGAGGGLPGRPGGTRAAHRENGRRGGRGSPPPVGGDEATVAPRVVPRLPPPMRPASEIEGWGERNGRRVRRAWPAGRRGSCVLAAKRTAAGAEPRGRWNRAWSPPGLRRR
jgi:hypothetical protein